MRVVFDEADLIKILSKHFGTTLSPENVKITADPFEIDVRDVEELPLASPPQPETTVAEELQSILVAAAQQVSTETETQEEAPMLKPDASTLTLNDLLNPEVSKHASQEEIPPEEKRKPLPPLPKLTDYFDQDDTEDTNENVHYDDPGRTTQAEIEASKRQRKGDS